ncbi:MAG TPA: hypothetical protein DIW61_04720 [Candidatus Aminicenantes bacterium]|nr:hypothetical protein [Candidatus Aminicenantes bacterium]
MKPDAGSPIAPPPDKLVPLLGRFQTSALALILANLVPLFGVVALGWNAAAIVVFYWAENLIVGFFNILRMKRAQGSLGSIRMTLNGRPVTEANRTALILFFIVHYGFFTLGHGVFVLTIFGPRFEGSLRDLGTAVLGLAVSHGISYRENFIGQGEYQKVSFAALFWQPYSRVIVMHLTIILGGALAQAIGSPVPALILMVVLKTLVDLASHLAERRKFLQMG